MRQGSTVVTPPDGHPLALGDAKLQLRIDAGDTDQDAQINRLIGAAHRHVENALGYPILRQTRETHYRGFPCGTLKLDGGASTEVTAITYFDDAGAEQTLASADYILDAVARRPEIWRPANVSWPSVPRRPGAVKVTWIAGWASADDVPEDMLHAMRLLIGHWDQNREGVIVGTISSEVEAGIEALLRPFRLPALA